MKYKAIKRNSILLMIALLTGCNDAKYDVIDSMIYIRETQAQTYVSQKVPIRKVDMTVTLTPCTGQAVTEDTKIQSSINEADLASFNQRNGTSYVLLPPSNYSIENESVIIKQGEQNASAIKITFKPITPEMMKSGKTYALPVSITSDSNIKTLKGSDMIVYVMDPLKIISAPVIHRYNYLQMKMRQDYTLKEWSVEFRLSIDKLGTDVGEYNNQAMFVANGPTGTDGEEIYTRFGDAFLEGNRLQIKNKAQLESNMHFNINTWYHIAFVNDGTKITLYVNGVKDSETATKGQAVHLDKDNFTFGAAGQYMVSNVKVSELRFWTKPISQSQIQNNMFNVNPSSDGLEAYWRLNEGEGNDFADLTGHGNICTSSGTTNWIDNIIADNKPDNEVENVEN